MSPPIALLLALQGSPELTAVRAEEPPHVDGRLGDAAWKNAPVAAAFTQKFPDEGKAPSERTEVRIVYDDDALYVGVTCEQRRSPLTAQLTRRDRETESDSFTISIDSRLDRKTAMDFQVSAAGVLVDGIHFDDVGYSSDWDETWEAHAAPTETGWTAELRIPFRVLRFPEGEKHVFGLQLRRYVAARRETDEWAPIPRADNAEVSRYGRLTGIAGVEDAAGVEVRPFVSARLVRYDREGGAPLAEPALVPKLGADVKWHPSQALTLDATLMPDFGQIEADQVILNLSTYETFLPEKRPFFQEGLELFQTPLPLLYTRRIGAAPYLPSLGDGEEALALPDPAPIYGALKLTGDLGHGLSVGQLSALVGPSALRVRAPDGDEIERHASPMTSFSALRLRQDLSDAVQIGLLATAAKTFDPASAHPTLAPEPGASGGAQTLCPDGTTVRRGYRCSTDAYALGADATFRSPSGDYVAKGQVLGTFVRGGPPVVAPGGHTLEPGDTGAASSVELAKQGGAVRFSAIYQLHSEDADYNTMGYMWRPNLHDAWGYVEYVTKEPFGPVQDTTTGLSLWYNENGSGVHTGAGAGLRTNVVLRNHWHMGARAGFEAKAYEDREIGDGTSTPRAGTLWAQADISSDPSAPVSAWLWNRFEGTSFGLRYFAESGIDWRPLSELDLSVSGSLESRDDEPRFVERTDTELLFRERRVEIMSLTLRGTYMFAPELSLQGYAQAFLASVRFGAPWSIPNELAPPGTVVRLESLEPGGSGTYEPSFSSAALVTNMLLRWEYRLGSTLFFVWSHSQDDYDEPGAPRKTHLDLGKLAPRRANEAFVVKASYWWG